VVRSLPLTAVRWLVIVVVVYTALNMLLMARSDVDQLAILNAQRSKPVR